MPIVEYRCKHCRKLFSQRQAAVLCEKSHICPVKVSPVRYVIGKYPLTIDATYDDGKIIRYIQEDEYLNK